MWYSRSFAAAQDDNALYQILHFACGSVYGGKERASFRMGQRTANKPDLYLIERQIVIKFCCSWSVLFWGGREQGYFALCCISMNYKKLMFVVLCP